MDYSFVDSYGRASRRLLLLDYDGTLREFEPQTELAIPTAEVKRLLSKLAADPKNTVAITTGRDHQTLDDWLGDLPVYFVAEHGAVTRAPGDAWQFAQDLPTAWQSPVRELMEKAEMSVPKSLIETKSNSLVWHYRAVDAKVAGKALTELLDGLAILSKEYDLRVLDGSKAVEVQPVGVDKGSSTRDWFDIGAYDFVLAMGDDVTDEDLFRAMPPDAFTVKVGDDETAASDRVPNPAAARELLAKLASGR